ncbi:DUF4386 domain-containing protein [Maritalea mediterranea]|uniref:DUF4386 domain-containing protein n=1 Tax=Maritalea mediterranea TaxID=2909667 RepID=A0ABS9E4K2_9HYPH|nr:DUF4386 domain-containing protein [Maritalea mediterranea]MCF4097790.1 DUF4386 domain-containing protein [Maritalea mediterranea]
MTQPTYLNRNAARLAGIFFIGSFLSYGIGTALMEPLLLAADPITTIESQRITYLVAAFAVAILHTFTNVGAITILFRAMSPFAPLKALGYLSLTLMGTMALLVGSVFLMLAVPTIDATDPLYTEAFGKLLYYINFYFYQSGMTLWGVGGLLMCAVLWRTQLVPRSLAILGVVGYTIFIVGTTSEFFLSGWGVMLSIPGGLFEVGLSIWLIAKGFNASANTPHAHQAASSMA